MDKKKNTGLFTIVGVLIFLVLVLVLLLAVLVWKSMTKSEVRRSGNQTSNVQINSEVQDDVEEMHFVLDGYEFTVPGDYNLTYTDATGTVVFKEDVFQMKMAVVDNSYEEVMENPEELTQAIVDAGGSIVQDMKESEVDGKKYGYYRATLQEDLMLVIYTGAPDEGQRIAGQIVLMEENVSDEDMLEMFADIAAKAEKTDKENSTKDDIVVEMAEKKPSSIDREWIAESSMQFGEAKINHKIPENFFLEDAYEGSEYVTERYCMVEPYVTVTRSLFDSPWYENAEDYITRNKHLDNTKVQTMDVEGNKVYYIVESFLNGEKEYQQIYAGCDVGEQQFYVAEVYVIGNEIELTVDLIREFLILE